MTEDRQYTRPLAAIKVWLSQITDKHILKGTTIIALTGLLSAAVSYSNSTKIGVPIAGAGGIINMMSAAAALIMTILGWILSSLVYHAGAGLLGGKGNLNRMFALSSYSSIPLLIQGILRFIYYVILGKSPSMPATKNVLTILVYNFTLFNIASLIFIASAVMLNYGVSGKKAVFIALLPTLISIAFTIFLR